MSTPIGTGNSGTRRILLIVVAAVVIIGLLAFAASPPADNPDDQNVGSSHNAAQEGTLALYTWLGKINYKVERIEYGPFEIPAAATALFVIEPGSDLSQIERENLLAWLRQGNTLIWAETGFQTSQLLRDWHISLTATTSAISDTLTAQPLTSPPVGKVNVGSSYRLDIHERTDATTVYLGTKDAALLIGFSEGKGHVYVTSAPHIFSNLGLQQADNGALVLNLLHGTLDGSTIAMDEVHHGYTGSDDLSTVLFTQRWGWGVLYALVLLALYLVLSGRRFGRIVPLVAPDTRRSSAEYVEAAGGMFRRAGQRAWVVEHYRNSLRADLARPFGIDPHLPAAAFVDELTHISARPIDRSLLLGVLNQLDTNLNPQSGQAYNEGQLLDLSRRVEQVHKMILG
jgi:hypothetical protein